jgi:hypothetical protein
MQKNKNTLFWTILGSFLLIPLIVSVISSIHVINFFELSNYKSLAIALSVSFEIGALSALAGLVVMDKINKNVIYFIFVILTLYQMMGNTYYAYDMLSQKMIIDPNLINNWTELFGFETDDLVLMKRIIAIISGAILPIVSLCFLDLSVDYIKKNISNSENPKEDLKKKFLTNKTEIVEEPIVELIEETKKPEPIIEEPIVLNKTTIQEEVSEPQEQSSTKPDEVITESDKKVIRHSVNEKTAKSSNKISMVPKTGFHNLTYRK